MQLTLFTTKTYHYCVDMWSFGCMLAGLVFKRNPFFRAHGNDEQLQRIVDVLGTQGLQEYIEKYGLKLDKSTLLKLGKCRKRDWSEFASTGIEQFVCTELYDLLDNLLIYDHQVTIFIFTQKVAMSSYSFKYLHLKLCSDW